MSRFNNRTIMLTVGACLLPGLAVQAMLLAPLGVVVNLGVALVTVLVTECVCLALARKPWYPTIGDGSALVTALILAAALPPGAVFPVAWAALFAIALGKHAYGGLGHNIFNPAMVGYAIVLVSFPATLASWPGSIDGLSGATALTTFKYRGSATVDDVWLLENGFGALGGVGLEWAGLAFALGGLLLMVLRLAAWRPVVGMLGSLAALSILTYDNGSSASLGSPFYHWFSGSTLLAACFVATDPVTHPGSRGGQWLFGLLVGSVTFAIRSFGNYPDGIAFAILLANGISPWLDQRLPGLSRTHQAPGAGNAPEEHG